MATTQLSVTATPGSRYNFNSAIKSWQKVSSYTLYINSIAGITLHIATTQSLDIKIHRDIYNMNINIL